VNAVKVYMGIIYEDDKKIAVSYQSEFLSGEVISSDNFVIKKQGLENLIANIIKRILEQSDKDNIVYIGIYTDYWDAITYINRLVDNKNYDHLKQLRYQPRGRLFKLLKKYKVKFILSISPKSEVYECMKQNALTSLEEFSQVK